MVHGEENEREVMSNLPYLPAEELGGVEDGEGPENYNKLKGEVNIDCDDEEKGVLNATPEQIQEWQKVDETLENVCKLAEEECMEDGASEKKYTSKAGLLYRIWRPQGVKKG